LGTIAENLKQIKSELPSGVELVAVGKTHPPEVILEAYHAGHRAFGENKVQELIAKASSLPNDIEWHLIGHLQTNKVKYIASFIHLIHSVDSLKLLTVINKEGEKNGRVIECLLQIFIATEESKFGMDENELEALLRSPELVLMKNIRICGLMGMASFSNDMKLVREEFHGLNQLFKKIKQHFFAEKDYFNHLSMGMSSDYKIAVEEGATLVRIGSVIFGERNYANNQQNKPWKA
jgi:pyridoxal phosphate enzyme (YggS family)